MKLKTLIAGIVLVSVSSLVMAAENVGPYIGGNLGFTAADTGTFSQDAANDLVASGYTSASVTVDQSSNGFKIFSGYQINEQFAVEGYYANLGSYDYTVFTTGPTRSGSGNVEVTGIGVDLLGMLPFSPTLSGFARVGFFQWDAKGNAKGSFYISDSSGSDVKFGLGAEWKMGAMVNLRTEWEYYNFNHQISMLSVGIVSRF